MQQVLQTSPIHT
jgi:poly(beta-D-mannuronate) C5 epimerase